MPRGLSIVVGRKARRDNLRETARSQGTCPSNAWQSDAHFGAPPISTRWPLAIDPKYAVIATRSGLPSSGGVPARPPLMQDRSWPSRVITFPASGLNLGVDRGGIEQAGQFAVSQLAWRLAAVLVAGLAGASIAPEGRGGEQLGTCGHG